MGAEGRGDPGAYVGGGGRPGGKVALDVVAAPQEQRYEDGVGPAQAVQGVREQRPVQLDVAEPDVEAGAQVAHQVQEGQRGAQGLRVAAAVCHGDQGRGGRAAVLGGAVGLPGAVHGSGGSVPGDEAELGAEPVGDAGEELRGAVGHRGRPVRLFGGLLRHAPMVPGEGCRAVARGSQGFSAASRWGRGRCAYARAVRSPAGVGRHNRGGRRTLRHPGRQVGWGHTARAHLARRGTD